MNRFGAFVLIFGGFYAMIAERDFTQFIACFGWACALVNRAELEDFKRAMGGTP